jgi:hypothetical protein
MVVGTAREVAMWSLLEWGRRSNETATCNARAAATILCQVRVEREDLELFLAELASRRPGERTTA